MTQALSPKVKSSVEIRVNGVFALFALEYRLTYPVCFLTMRAVRTSTASIPWAHSQYGNTNHFSFVLNAITKVRKTPVTKRSLKLPRNSWLNTKPDVLEVFKNNTSSECLGLCYKSFGYSVIGLFLKSGLSTRHFPQSTFSVLCPLSLVLLSGSGPSPTVSSNVFPTEDLSSAVSSDVDDTKINTNPVFNVNRGSLFILNRDVEEEHPVSVDEISLTHLTKTNASKVISNYNWYSDPTVGGTDTNLFYPNQTIKMGIQWYSSQRSKCGAYFFVRGKCFHSSTNSSNRKLRAQTELFSKLVIAEFMDAYLTVNFVSKTYLRSLRGNGIYRPHRIKEVITLLIIR